MPRVAPALDYAKLSEHELVARAKAGEREAFRAIMQRCNQRLFRVARAVMRDDFEAEDVLYAAYGKAFTKLDSFREDAALSTWLTTIVLNEARGRLRRRRPTVELTPAVESRIIPFPGSESLDPEAEAARAQARRLIERAVDALPESYRLVFLMREIEECSVEETAQNLGLKPETVKTRLHRARHKLRESLEATLGSATAGAFVFLGARCERIQARVVAELERQGLVH